MEDWYKKLKPGDKFVCKDKAEPNPSPNGGDKAGGAGFISGKEYILHRRELRTSYAILWPINGASGVYSNSVLEPIGDDYDIY